MPPQLCVHVLQLNELHKVTQSVCVCVFPHTSLHFSRLEDTFHHNLTLTQHFYFLLSTLAFSSDLNLKSS